MWFLELPYVLVHKGPLIRIANPSKVTKYQVRRMPEAYQVTLGLLRNCNQLMDYYPVTKRVT